jgi:hypothetical protein
MDSPAPGQEFFNVALLGLERLVTICGNMVCVPSGQTQIYGTATD